MDNLFLTSENFIKKEYDTKILIYENQIKMTRYISPISKNKADFELLSESKYKSTDIYKKKQSNEKRLRYDNLARTRDKIIDYALANESDWKSFFTLTFAENITDLTYANKLFNIWRTSFTRACKKLDIEFKYLCVPEFQKRGAVHYHLLTNIDIGCSLIPNQINKKTGKIEPTKYDVKYWEEKNGFTSVFDIKNDTDDKFNVALYVCKYLYKDIDDRLFGHHKLLKSNNLKSPTIKEIQSKEMLDIIDYLQSKSYTQYHFIPNTEQLNDNKYLKGYIGSSIKINDISVEILNKLKSS